MIILQTEQLTKQFGKLIAVNHVDISVQRGEIFGLLGPNGAGKTTMLKMFTTLLSPSFGTVKISGFDIVKQPNKVRQIIGYVPQMLSADGTLTGYENLLIFAKIYDLPAKTREKRIWELLELMNLKDSANFLVRTYSGGMIRRLEIAQSLLHQPHILFLDEPTVGLDPIARQTVWDRIIHLSKEYDLTIILTTHYMEEAENLCTHLAIMHLGKVVAQGTQKELKKSAGDPDMSMDKVFSHYAGAEIEIGGNIHGLREISETRQTARRLG
jgi:ABC-2 type transport system ATP-binding protein